MLEKIIQSIHLRSQLQYTVSIDPRVTCLSQFNKLTGIQSAYQSVGRSYKKLLLTYSAISQVMEVIHKTTTKQNQISKRE